ncbi:hypothetical protein [Sutcliffiella deserti]|uniref:hypothetical protein n=1 Tax=Sutcliffiella deserti TaxID=2875501 RepID=UPI001CBF6BFA|nr:hypothetical protein [Sutcliffiella deserti]
MKSQARLERVHQVRGDLLLKGLIWLSILIFTLVGCSSPTLQEAIEKNHDQKVEILYQDDVDEVVLFMTEDYTGEPLLCLNTFTKENSGYKYNAGTGEHGQSVDLSSEYEIIKVSSVGDRSIGAIWGYFYDYPNAESVSYTLEDEQGNVIYTSDVEISEANSVYEKVPYAILEMTHNLYYQILDSENNVIVEW